jgi:hypothetical protein
MVTMAARRLLGMILMEIMALRRRGWGSRAV